MSLPLQASAERLRRMNWVQMASMNVTPRQAAAVKGCSVGRAADCLRSARAILGRDMGARLADGSFEAAATECGLQIVTVTLLETEAQGLMPLSEIKRLPKKRLGMPSEGLMQEMYNRVPVEGARRSDGKPLPVIADDCSDHLAAQRLAA